MPVFTKQIHFLASKRRKVLVGFILFVFLSFFIIFLEPFDTDQFQSAYRLPLLFGFGILIFVSFVVFSSLEDLWYARVRKVWLVSHEILSTILFFLFSGTIIYLYNGLLINNESYSVASHLHYLKAIVLLMIPVFAPLMIYLRQQFGERIVPAPSVPIDSVLVKGENKSEILTLQKEQLLFVKAFENYVEIWFVENGSVVSRTFRQTLSNMHRQIPFLERCHRSYLVNRVSIKAVSGNSQSAEISFRQGDKKIPLSKTHYKEIRGGFVEL